MSPYLKWSLYIIATLILTFGLWQFCLYQNNAIEITTINLHADTTRTPIRVVHLSDLQCKQFGDKQATLTTHIKKLKPDLIIFTGDLVDAFHYNTQNWQDLASQLPKIAPTYFVSGNHEWWHGNHNTRNEILRRYSIHVLQNDETTIQIHNHTLTIIGIDDPESHLSTKAFLTQLRKLGQGIPPSSHTLLLTHRPEYFSEYDRPNIDIVFAGHAHGGQIRLPFLGGLLAPNQGLFPKYTAGLYTGTYIKMIVSRGLGNSIFPLRLFNRPEIVLTTI